MAVSLDEAWGDSLGFGGAGGAGASAGGAALVDDEDDPEPLHAPPPPRRSKKGSVRAPPMPPMPPTDLGSCLEALQHVSKELRDMRTLFARQQNEQKIVLYVATAIVILLLLFTAHSYSRLQYASDCMMHWRR